MRHLVIIILMLTLSGCTQLLFHPTPQHVITPDKVGLAYRDYSFNSSDGTRLHGWWLPAEGEAIATVLYVHGNAQNIGNHLGNAYWLPAKGVNLFIFDYRGYGESRGDPSLPGVIADVEMALIHASALSGKTPLILMSHSLGAAVSIYTLAHSQEKSRLSGAIFASSFSDYHLITREVLAQVWFLWPFQYPLSWTINNDYSPIDSVADIAPLSQLYLHSPEDQIIDIHHSEALFAKAGEPKQLVRVSGGHNDVFGSEKSRQVVLEAIRRWSSPSQ